MPIQTVRKSLLISLLLPNLYSQLAPYTGPFYFFPLS